MRICYLHIGMPKTGTMSIQASLGKAPSLPGIKYLMLAKQTNCSAALMEIYAGEIPQRERAKRALWTADEHAARKAQLLKQLRNGFSGDFDRFVLSGEQLHNLTLEQLTALQKELASHVDEVRVLAYVREAASWMESAFQQRVKTGDVADFNNLRRVLPEYRSKLERFDKAFGRDKVTLWKFEPATFVGKDVVLDFCSKLGFEFDPGQIVLDNEGVSRDGVGLLYLYRHYAKPAKMTAQDKQDVRLLMRQMGSLSGDKMRIAPKVLAPYLADIAADMAWMEGRLGAIVSTPPTAKPGAIATEAELLTPTQKGVAWLGEQLGRQLVADGASASGEQVAAWMEEWLKLLKLGVPSRPVKTAP